MKNIKFEEILHLLAFILFLTSAIKYGFTNAVPTGLSMAWLSLGGALWVMSSYIAVKRNRFQ